MANELTLELVHAFDKAAYNRQYYQKNKDLWQQYYSNGQTKPKAREKQVSTGGSGASIRTGSMFGKKVKATSQNANKDYSKGTPSTKTRREEYNEKKKEFVKKALDAFSSAVKKDAAEERRIYNKAMAGSKKVKNKMNEAYAEASYARGKGTLNHIPSSKKAINNLNAKIAKYGTPAPSSSKNKYYQEAMAKASYARGKATMPTSVNEKKKKKSSPAAKAKKFLKKLFKW